MKPLHLVLLMVILLTLGACDLLEIINPPKTETITIYVPNVIHEIGEAEYYNFDSKSSNIINEFEVDSTLVLNPSQSNVFIHDNIATSITLIGGHFKAPVDTTSWRTIFDFEEQDDDPNIPNVYDTVCYDVSKYCNYAIFRTESNGKVSIDSIWCHTRPLNNYYHRYWYSYLKSIEKVFDKNEYDSVAEFRKEVNDITFGNMINSDKDFEVYFLDVYPFWEPNIAHTKLIFRAVNYKY